MQPQLGKQEEVEDPRTETRGAETGEAKTARKESEDANSSDEEDGSGAKVQAGTQGQGAAPGHSHELPDQVPGDELDGLRLVLQAQGSETLPNGMLISEEHDGTVTLGQRLQGQEGQLRSWSIPTSSRVVPSSLHPSREGHRRLAGAQAAGLPRIAGAQRKPHRALPLNAAA